MKVKTEAIRIIKERHAEWLATSGKYGKRADLRYADLGGTNVLCYANLSFALMIGANLNGCFLEGINFTGAILADACFREANMAYADLSHAIMTRADLSLANLDQVDVKGADMFCCNLFGAGYAGLKNWFLARNTTACIFEDRSTI
jgi:uncharacterized protein YjbI with pentapeptide repeats